MSLFALFTQCVLCNLPATATNSLCRHCIDALPWHEAGCARCGLAIPAQGLHDRLCGKCLSRPAAFDACRALLHYTSPVDWLISRFKFHADFATGYALATLLAEEMARCYDQVTDAPQAIVPIPLHARRLRTRGFNQALEIARPLGRALDLPIVPGALRRHKPTVPQSLCPSAESRRANLAGAFVAEPRVLGSATRVILVDDVITTMSTVGAAAGALRACGVKSIHVWGLARVNL